MTDTRKPGLDDPSAIAFKEHYRIDAADTKRRKMELEGAPLLTAWEQDAPNDRDLKREILIFMDGKQLDRRLAMSKVNVGELEDLLAAVVSNVSRKNDQNDLSVRVATGMLDRLIVAANAQLPDELPFTWKELAAKGERASSLSGNSVFRG